MSVLVLDAEAFSVLADRRDSRALRRVHAALAAAAGAGAAVLVPAACLAELYRSGGWNQRVDAVLGRHGAIQVGDTDRALAKLIGRLLASAGLGSAHHVDASVVAVGVIRGGGLVLTGDPKDLTRLAASAAAVNIESL